MAAQFKLPLGDVPLGTAARWLGLTPEAFEKCLPDLIARGFPAADQTTGNFDLEAIEVWRRQNWRRRRPVL